MCALKINNVRDKVEKKNDNIDSERKEILNRRAAEGKAKIVEGRKRQMKDTPNLNDCAKAVEERGSDGLGHCPSGGSLRRGGKSICSSLGSRSRSLRRIVYIFSERACRFAPPVARL